MKKHSLLLSCFALLLGSAHAQVPADCQDVLLQGFFWNSQQQTGWAQLLPAVNEIGQNFTGIWLPPSANPEGGYTVGGSNVGYHPRVWNDQNSCWGTADNLKTLITAFHNKGVKVIADIVINHRAGYTDWANFSPDNFGAYGSYQLTLADICRNDEVNTEAGAATFRATYGMATGANDTGENWSGARDLDHTSANVQNDIKAYLNWMKGEMGYDGWRYDFVKGFEGKYVGIYNDASQPWLSVGEYWDGNYDAVKAWLAATGYKSMAFDFPQKYAALNNGLAKNNYANMAWKENGTTPRPAGLIHNSSTNRYAVTFVDNHDTYRDDNKYTGNVAQAYAFLLSAPGVPCVFWPHWVGNKTVIKSQIAARRVAGVTSQSNCEVVRSSTYYESRTEGKNGTLICRIGNVATMPKTVPDGYFRACGGNNWAFYLPTALQSVYTGVQTPTVTPRSETSVYDLQGRRVSTTHSGLYLINGQKVLVK